MTTRPHRHGSEAVKVEVDEADMYIAHRQNRTSPTLERRVGIEGGEDRDFRRIRQR